jgi:ABC-2 type transport system ATP-binding protein
MNDPAIEVEGLRKHFGEVVALDGLDLVAPAGSVLALLGPNGAGKTTLVRALATLLVPDAGSARVLGHDVVAEPFAVRREIGLAGQFAAIDEILTGRENLEMVGRLYHLGRAAAARRASDVLERFGLADAADRRAGHYSGGMRRRLDLAATLVGDPRVLFLDEPTTGLDPRSRTQLWEMVRELRSGGTTILLTTQYLEEADQLAQSIAVIDQGRIVAEGTALELKERVGRDRLIVRVAERSHADDARAALGALSGVDGGLDATGETELSLPMTSADLPAAVVRGLDRAGIGIVGLEVRTPTLDDVFFALTGRHVEPAEPDAEPREGVAA